MRSKDQHIFLASSSPRRAELLAQMGIHFEVIPVSVPESPVKNELCDDYVSRLAMQKAKAGMDSRVEMELVVIGADTVILFNDQILEKPKDEKDAFKKLASLSNKTHLVKKEINVCNREKHKTVVQTNRVT